MKRIFARSSRRWNHCPRQRCSTPNKHIVAKRACIREYPSTHSSSARCMSPWGCGRALSLSSQVLSLSHSTDQTIPRSKQKIAELPRSIPLSQKTFGCLPQTRVSVLQSQGWEHVKILAIDHDSVPRYVIAPDGTVMR